MVTTILLVVIAMSAVWLVVKGIRDDVKEEYFDIPNDSFIKVMEKGESNKNIKMEKPPEIRVSSRDEGWIRTKNKESNILIPQDLNEEEKQILKDFYNL